MPIDEQEIERIATLAKLLVAEPEKPGYARDISNIVGLFQQLSAIDTDKTQPMAHPLDMTQRLRNDEVTETNQRERLQQLAPEVADGLYLVPKVID